MGRVSQQYLGIVLAGEGAPKKSSLPQEISTRLVAIPQSWCSLAETHGCRVFMNGYTLED